MLKTAGIIVSAFTLAALAFSFVSVDSPAIKDTIEMIYTTSADITTSRIQIAYEVQRQSNVYAKSDKQNLEKKDNEQELIKSFVIKAEHLFYGINKLAFVKPEHQKKVETEKIEALPATGTKALPKTVSSIKASSIYS